MTALFSPGCLFVTPGIHALVRRGMDVSSLLSRHLQGDCGDIVRMTGPVIIVRSVTATGSNPLTV